MIWSACLRILGTGSSRCGLSFSLLQSQRPLGASLTTKLPRLRRTPPFPRGLHRTLLHRGRGVGVEWFTQQAGPTDWTRNVLLALLLCVQWEGVDVRKAAGCPGLRWQHILKAWKWSGSSLCTDSTHCSQRVRVWAGESDVSGSNWAAGATEEAEEVQAGAIGGIAPISAQHCPSGSISLWPEMNWPGQWGCQEDIAAGDRRG